jgi:hypothetical protein
MKTEADLSDCQRPTGTAPGKQIHCSQLIIKLKDRMPQKTMQTQSGNYICLVIPPLCVSIGNSLILAGHL